MTETLFWFVLLSALGYWLYRKGKRIGSRKGFHVGRRRNMFRRKNRPR